MQTIALGQTGRSTTRLGFGCSSVMGALGRKESLAMLETAFEAGLRHFDVAPMYGYGEAEGCVGEFLSRHPGQATVTTKYGIPPEAKQLLKVMMRRLARPVFQMLPGVKQRLAAAAQHVSTGSDSRSPKASFTAVEARTSLEHSLSELRTDHIDIWLLHEATAGDLNDDLLRLLEDSVAAGKIGSFGVGSGSEKIPALLVEHPAFCRVLQYEWSVLDQPISTGAAFRIHHRALTENFLALHGALTAKPEISGAWSADVGVDVFDAETLAQLMLKASLVMNPESILLFSSKRPAHIEANARLADDGRMEAAARRFYALVQADKGELLGAAGVAG